MTKYGKNNDQIFQKFQNTHILGKNLFFIVYSIPGRY